MPQNVNHAYIWMCDQGRFFLYTLYCIFQKFSKSISVYILKAIISIH